MRVVMIGPFAWSPKGTVSARAFFMARALVDRGHAVTILMPPYDHPSHAGWEWEKEGVRLINLTLPSWGDSWRARLTLPLALARRAVELAPDLIHVFKPLGYAGLSGVVLHLFWPRFPLVVDSDDWDGPGGWADVKGHVTGLGRVLAWQERWLLRRAHAVTVASRTLQAQMRALSVPHERLYYLPNGPDRLLRQPCVPEASQRRLRRALGAGDAPLAVYVGHISYGSEVDLVLEALPRILKAFPDLRVLIVGDGEGVPALQEHARRAGLAEHVIFCGRRDPEQTMVYLAAADLALYPYRDTLVNRAKSPSKMTAYMALGKPIVASAVGENVAYLDGGRAGLLVAPGDAAAFARGVLNLLKDPARAAELGQRARQRVWACYAWSRQVIRLEQAYATALRSASK